MDRRKFFSVTSAGAAVVAAGSVSAADAAAPAKMAGGACASAKLPPLKARLGHQFGRTEQILGPDEGDGGFGKHHAAAD